MADHANSPKIERAAIMRSAWAAFNRHFAARPWLKRVFSRSDFSFYLASAWSTAKRALIAAREARAAVIRDQIELLSFKSLRVDTAAQRRALETELSALAA